MVTVDVAAIAGFAGFIASQVIELLKPGLARIGDKTAREKATILTSGAISLAVAALFAFSASRLGYLSEEQVWAVIGLAWPASWGTYQLESRRKIAKAQSEIEQDERRTSPAEEEAPPADTS